MKIKWYKESEIDQNEKADLLLKIKHKFSNVDTDLLQRFESYIIKSDNPNEDKNKVHPA